MKILRFLYAWSTHLCVMNNKNVALACVAALLILAFAKSVGAGADSSTAAKEPLRKLYGCDTQHWVSIVSEAGEPLLLSFSPAISEAAYNRIAVAIGASVRGAPDAQQRTGNGGRYVRFAVGTDLGGVQALAIRRELRAGTGCD